MKKAVADTTVPKIKHREAAYRITTQRLNLSAIDAQYKTTIQWYFMGYKVAIEMS